MTAQMTILDGPPHSDTPLPRPRTRWAAIVWGAVFAALAAAGIGLSSDPASLDTLASWLQEVEIGALVGYGLLTVGALVLVVGLIGLLRRAQIAKGRRPSDRA